jgi:GGDEF domain-containing protein
MNVSINIPINIPKESIQIIKNKLIDRLWFGAFIITIIGVPASILRSLSTDWLTLYSIHIFLGIVVILSVVKDKDSTRIIAQKLIDDLAKPYAYLDHDITITASVGISMFPENATNAKQLRKQADTAMYAVKKTGKNGIAFAS